MAASVPAGALALPPPKAAVSAGRLLPNAACVAGWIGHAALAAGQTLPPAELSGGVDAAFGGAVPSDRFVHEFQRQVMQQLQSTVEQANRQQDERLRHFEERQNERLREQSEALQRTIDPLEAGHPDDP